MIKYLSVLIVVLDQLTKFIVHSTMNLYDSIQVVPYLLNFTYIRNEGIAFGIYFEGAETIFIVLPILITIYLFYLLKNEEFQDKFSQIALFLIIAGAVGNIIDRIFRGYVVDFIDFHLNGMHWYVFNIADSSVTIGLIFLLYSSIIINK
ncbi:MAG: signal peptidase II [Candidatus Marinimicrobia bacterium]|jgi:signal peptidase II|nr:signal peptidase II [Candidatus Neomarinimicrobiota bacterium]|tara:strand:- start:1862 stop:2308 length:447 start_codon:yes stop_codon:yes gene_type:complete